MSLKLKTSLATILFLPTFAFAGEYDLQIKNLQNQINSLNKKLTEYENKKIDLSSSLDGLYFTGRLHATGSWVHKNSDLKNSEFMTYQHDDGHGNIINETIKYPFKNNDIRLKRARLGIGKEMGDFKFYLEVNHNNRNTNLGNAYMSYKFNDNNIIKIGQMTIPSFMEREKSSNTSATIEANSFEQLSWVPGYLMGINYIFTTDNMGIYTGIFDIKDETESNEFNNVKYNFSFRNFFSPLKSKDYTLHLGYDFMYNNYDEIYEPTPNYSYFYGLELGIQYKYINILTEFIKKYEKFDRNTHASIEDLNFNQYGVSTEFIVNFTGENIEYNSVDGTFGNVKVKNPLSKGGYGAWQGVFRYSKADGQDSDKGYFNNEASRYDYTVGLTWIPEDYMRVLFNYSKNSINDIQYNGKYDLFEIEFRLFF